MALHLMPHKIFGHSCIRIAIIIFLETPWP